VQSGDHGSLRRGKHLGAACAAPPHVSVHVLRVDLCVALESGSNLLPQVLGRGPGPDAYVVFHTTHAGQVEHRPLGRGALEVR
jgi:hypothetical protein